MWYISVINKFSKEINQYIQLKDIYLSIELLGEYENAEKILRDIKLLACSVWSLENDFVVAEYTYGLYGGL